MATTKIKRIKLSDGTICNIFDTGALRLNENGILVTDNEIVNQMIINRGLCITTIDDVPVDQLIHNVLVQDTTTNEIKKRTANQLLSDIGGFSCSVDNDSATIIFKQGKQS